MNEDAAPQDLVRLDVDQPIWDRFFSVAPLVVVGSRGADGTYDLAPKHMVTPLGWDNYFGFVCTPSHETYQNVRRSGVFTVTFPTTESVVATSLAASPRYDDRSKPALAGLATFSAEAIDGRFLSDGYLFLECQLERIVDGFGINSLIAGTIVGAQVSSPAVRRMDIDDAEVLAANPLLVYIAPGRFARLDHGNAFPFPAGFRRGDEA